MMRKAIIVALIVAIVASLLTWAFVLIPPLALVLFIVLFTGRRQRKRAPKAR